MSAQIGFNPPTEMPSTTWSKSVPRCNTVG
jgi:hypothetical protein